MKDINDYINEKLVIDKDTKKPIPITKSERLIEIAGGNFSDKDIKKIFDDWLGDYDKRIYFYYYELDHSRFKEYIKKYDDIVVQSVQDSVMKKTMDGRNFEDVEMLYESDNEIKSIKKVRNNDLLVISDKCWYKYPIIIERGL